eukprot:Pgem_evm1s7492
MVFLASKKQNKRRFEKSTRTFGFVSNIKRRLREFKIDDQVFIKNETYDQGDNTSKKFQRRFDGPMIITKRLGEIRNIDEIKEYHERETHGFDDIGANTEIEITEIVDDNTDISASQLIEEYHGKIQASSSNITCKSKRSR